MEIGNVLGQNDEITFPQTLWPETLAYLLHSIECCSAPVSSSIVYLSDQRCSVQLLTVRTKSDIKGRRSNGRSLSHCHDKSSSCHRVLPRFEPGELRPLASSRYSGLSVEHFSTCSSLLSRVPAGELLPLRDVPELRCTCYISFHVLPRRTYFLTQDSSWVNRMSWDWPLGSTVGNWCLFVQVWGQCA